MSDESGYDSHARNEAWWTQQRMPRGVSTGVLRQFLEVNGSADDIGRRIQDLHRLVQDVAAHPDLAERPDSVATIADTVQRTIDHLHELAVDTEDVEDELVRRGWRWNGQALVEADVPNRPGHYFQRRVVEAFEAAYTDHPAGKGNEAWVREEVARRLAEDFPPSVLGTGSRDPIARSISNHLNPQ